MSHDMSTLTEKLQNLVLNVQEIDPYVRQALHGDVHSAPERMSIKVAKSLRKKLMKVTSSLALFETKLNKAIQDCETDRPSRSLKYKECLIPDTHHETHRMPEIKKRITGGRACFNDV